MAVRPQPTFSRLRELVAAMAVCVAAACAVRAATFTVSNTNDAGPGSLRQAVIDANGSAGVDTISIDPSINGNTINLTSPLPALTDGIIFSGPTSSSLSISSASPIFTGAVSFVKQDAGTLIVSGTNSYTGGTTVSTGILQGNTSSIQGDIANNATVVFDQSVAGTYSGNMSGIGTLTKEGAGTLILTGNNYYSGGATVSGGALRGNTASLPGDIQNNAEVIFDQASSGTYTGNLSGSGSLTKQGTGTLTMGGINTYSGGTTVSAGALRGNTANLPGDIENNAAVIFDQATNGTYAGDMSGIGILTKEGIGTLMLSGTNTYSGGTTVSAGAIRGSSAGVQGDIINNGSVVFDQPTDGTYSGEISGSGMVTKQGAGKLTMTGINTYNGGTTVIAGTLAGNTLSLQGNILNNGSIDFEQAVAGTYADDMSGTGSLIKRGNGALTLSGTNSYSGGTSVTEGSLQGNTQSVQGNITNNATIVFDQASAGTYSGDMTGTGALVKQGAGTLTLSGSNSYSGGTTVNAGIVLGNSASVRGDITNDSAVVFDQAVQGTYSGNMSGTGSLTKQGTGNLIVSGVNTYVGSTTVSSGRFTVNGSLASETTVQSGGELFGEGQVGNLINQGVVAPGNSIGTLTVNGNYTQTNNATLQLEITPSGQSDRINATGSATIDGSLVVTGGGSFSAGTTYTILTAPNGVNGTFSNTLFLFGNGLYTNSQIIGYGSNELQLLVMRNPTMFASLADTPNQAAIATTLDTLNPLATGDRALVIDQLNLLAPPAARNAFDQLSGEIYADLPAVEFENTTRYLSLVTERIRNNSCYSLACCSIDDEEERFERAPPWNAWVLGYGMGGDISGDGNASGVDYTLMGTAIGVDSDLDEFTSLGVAYGFTPFLLDRSSDRADAEAHQISVYANRLFGQQYLLGVVSFGQNDFEVTRRIAFDGVNRTAESEFSSGQFAFYVEAGGNRNFGNYFLQPLIGLQYVNVSQDAFNETGADSLNLAIPKTTTDSLRSALGGRIARPFFTESGAMVTPEIRARWMHEFFNDPQSVSPSFATAPDDSFTIRGVKLGRDFLVLGAGITAELTPSISAFANYDAQVSVHEQAHGGNGGLKWVW